MTEPGDAQAAGTVDSAADQIEKLMEPKGDPDVIETKDEDPPAETEEDQPSEDQPEEEADQPEEQPSYRVTVAGEEVEVTLDELVKGYSREADYTRKTMGLAQERQTLQSEAEAVRAERVRYASLLEQMEAQLVPTVSDQDMEWLKANNRTEYAIALQEKQAAEQRKADLRAERDRVLGLNSQDEAKLHEQHVREVVSELPGLIPDFADPQKAPVVAQKLQGYLANAGYAPDEIKWAKGRDLAIVWKAAQYDELTAKTPKAVQKVEAVKTARPGDGGLRRRWRKPTPESSKLKAEN